VPSPSNDKGLDNQHHSRPEGTFHPHNAPTPTPTRGFGSDSSEAPDIAALISEVQAESEEFRILWQKKDLAAFTPKSRSMYHPKLGKVELEYIKMHTAGDDMTLVAYMAPSGSELAEQLADVITEDGIKCG
jgi:hypothetical protein